MTTTNETAPRTLPRPGARALSPDEAHGADSPTLFTPTVPGRSFLGSVFWPFTIEGRARRRLLLAYKFPDELKRTEDVAKALAKLTAGKGQLSPTAKELHADLLVYLAWKWLALGETEKAAEALAHLDDSFPLLDAKTDLRWDLINVLWAAGDGDAYVNQVALFVADGQAGAPSRADAILQVIKTVYERFSPAACERVIDNAHATIRERAEIQAAGALCACPEVFEIATEAKRWTARISPANLAFSRLMAADAYLAAARAAETQGDWSGMLDSALQALQLAPAHQSALYWLTRAKLHSDDGNPTDHLGPAAISGESRWDRLQLLVALHQKPGIAAAVATCPMLEGKLGEMAQPEVLLLVELVRRALEAEPASAPTDIKAKADICQAVQAKAGASPWAQVCIAHSKVRLERKFRQAYELLEARDIIDQPQARRMARIARLLAGTPQKPATGATGDAITAMEWAAYRLLDAASAHAAPDQGMILQGLEACRGDDVFDQFPDLKEVVCVLTLALRVARGDAPASWGELQSLKSSQDAPTWLVWVHARICLLASDFDVSEGSEPLTLDTMIPIIAGAVDCWARNRSRPGAIDEATMKAARACLERWAARVPGAARHVVQAILAARRNTYRSFEGDESLSDDALEHSDVGELARGIRPSELWPELGELAGAACASELGLELRYARSRRAIARGETAKAASHLMALDESMDQACTMTGVWWRPLIRYWLGVALAYEHDDGAVEILKGRLDEPLRNEARGQLALLALRDGLVGDAAHWLEGASELVPSVRYAKALVLARDGKPQEARQLIESDDASRVFAGSAYALPAQRLAAAIEERSGQREESDRRHRAILAAHPGNEVASLRLGRSLLDRAYSQFQASRWLAGEPIADQLRELIPQIETDASWWQSYAVLYGMLNAPDDSLADAANVESRLGDVKGGLAWRQLLAARFLAAGDPDGALAALDIPVPADAPGWFVRSRLLLKTWRALTRLPGEAERAEAMRQLAGLARDAERFAAGNATVAAWRTLADAGVRLGSGEEVVSPDQWPSPASSPLANIRLLFGADARQRRAAGEALLPVISSDGAEWSKEQRLLLHALAAWAAEKDDLYVEHYSNLQPILDQLPVPVRDLWLPAALIRFSRGDWKGLAGDSLPDCLADLSDPLVCLIVELADARAAVGELPRSTQAVAQRIKGIHNNLVALVDRLDSHGSASNPG
jgi:hypothetical protein